jgi:hypothetical protein
MNRTRAMIAHTPTSIFTLRLLPMAALAGAALLASACSSTETVRTTTEKTVTQQPAEVVMPATTTTITRTQQTVP